MGCERCAVPYIGDKYPSQLSEDEIGGNALSRRRGHSCHPAGRSGNKGCRQVGTQQLGKFIGRNGLMEVKALALSTVLRFQRY